MLFRNAHLILPGRILPRGSLRVRNGIITAVTDQDLAPLPEEQPHDLQGRFLAPGFIDLHVHGALRRDAMEAEHDAFRTICEWHARGGTTALALTTVTSTADRIFRVLHSCKKFCQQEPTGARVLGIHIEGPYFSKEKPGAHRVDLIRNPQPAEYERWLALSECITQMTLAPELPGAMKLIEELVQAGIRPSAGHSDAWDDQAAEAFAHGLRQVTHTFNCMSSARREGPFRRGGLLEYALSEPEISCELIADGKHVSPTLMRMLYQAKGPEGIILVTDAAGGAGLAEGETFKLGQIDGIVTGGVALTADRQALCSSTSSMIQLVRNMVEMVDVPLAEAIGMATLNPARALKISENKGVLREGADADLVILNEDIEVCATYVKGKKVYSAP